MGTGVIPICNHQHWRKILSVRKKNLSSWSPLKFAKHEIRIILRKHRSRRHGKKGYWKPTKINNILQCGRVTEARDSNTIVSELFEQPSYTYDIQYDSYENIKLLRWKKKRKYYAIFPGNGKPSRKNPRVERQQMSRGVSHYCVMLIENASHIVNERRLQDVQESCKGRVFNFPVVLYGPNPKSVRVIVMYAYCRFFTSRQIVRVRKITSNRLFLCGLWCSHGVASRVYRIEITSNKKV